MPLPSTLLARLAKRGIVTQSTNDEEENTSVTPSVTLDGNVESQKHTAKSHKKRRIPAPPGWFRVPRTEGCHSYYWNVNTNEVSWLHPEDAEAKITMPASWVDKENSQDKEMPPSEMVDDSENSKPKFAKNVNVGKHPSLMKAKRDKERGAPYKSKKDRKARDDADPMDPSSYSDVARGSWSSGLVTSEDAKTGVDTTASGPLFQQRPYPSPGDILRRNQAAKK